MYPFNKPNHSMLTLEPMEACKRCDDSLPQSLIDDNGHCPECVREIQENEEQRDEMTRTIPPVSAFDAILNAQVRAIDAFLSILP